MLTPPAPPCFRSPGLHPVVRPRPAQRAGSPRRCCHMG
jgi:hypothetical protein